MPLYESVFLVRQEATPDRVEEISNSYAEVISAEGGSVLSRESWGLRMLAYPIRKNSKAHYTLFRLDAPSSAMAEMERKFRFDDEILRCLTLRVRVHSEEQSPLARRGGEEDSDSSATVSREKSARPDRSDRPDRSERSERPERSERAKQDSERPKQDSEQDSEEEESND